MRGEPGVVRRGPLLPVVWQEDHLALFRPQQPAVVRVIGERVSLLRAPDCEPQIIRVFTDVEMDKDRPILECCDMDTARPDGLQIHEAQDIILDQPGFVAHVNETNEDTIFSLSRVLQQEGEKTTPKIKHHIRDLNATLEHYRSSNQNVPVSPLPEFGTPPVSPPQTPTPSCKTTPIESHTTTNSPKANKATFECLIVGFHTLHASSHEQQQQLAEELCTAQPTITALMQQNAQFHSEIKERSSREKAFHNCFPDLPATELLINCNFLLFSCALRTNLYLSKVSLGSDKYCSAAPGFFVIL
ncbi:hypothetical protein Pelo_18651 [Pelomyxa schiedti]|nr:hypothetical protein Pelo_18651 [Pelomyxa schiedti]